MIRKLHTVGMLAALLVSAGAGATIVRFETPMGYFDVNLYDKRTPATVANFLGYVSSGAYNNMVVHRSVPGFVVQGGGYSFPGALPLGLIPERAPVINEPLLSNVRGTIAMAKIGGNPNSATNQWFVNVANNSANLDVQNGGFTVFGEVIGSGMAVIDAINALPTFVYSNVSDSLPLRNYTAANAAAGTPVTDQNIVYATSVYVLDSNVDSAASLTPTPNTLLGQPSGGGSTGGGSTGGGSASGSSGGGGGAMGAWSLLLGALALAGRLFRRHRGSPVLSLGNSSTAASMSSAGRANKVTTVPAPMPCDKP